MAGTKKAETAVEAFEDDEGHETLPDTLERARQLAAAVAIDVRPATARRHGASSPLSFTDRDEIAFWIGGDVRGSRRPSACVWSVKSRSELDTILSALRPTQSKRRPRWAYLDNPGMMDKQGAPLIFAGSTATIGQPEGVFACARHLSIFCTAEGLRLDYRVYCELIYVAPAARKRALGSSLVAAVAICVHEDLDQLTRGWRRVGAGVPISSIVSGDAYSEGGERAFEGLHSAMAYYADMAEDVPMEVERDWSV